jgi:hypothetical protein
MVVIKPEKEFMQESLLMLGVTGLNAQAASLNVFHKNRSDHRMIAKTTMIQFR